MIIEELGMIVNGDLPFGAPNYISINPITKAKDPMHRLHYEKNESGEYEPYKNFVLTYTIVNDVGEPESTNILSCADDLIRYFGLLDSRATAIMDYLTETLHTEIPFKAYNDGFRDDEGSHPLLYFKCMLHSIIDESEVDENGKPAGIDMESDTVKKVNEMIVNDVYARNTLAKFANMLEQGFNEAHYDTKAAEIAELIRSARVLDASGHFAPLTLIGVDNLLNAAKGRVLVRSLPEK